MPDATEISRIAAKLETAVAVELLAFKDDPLGAKTLLCELVRRLRVMNEKQMKDVQEWRDLKRYGIQRGLESAKRKRRNFE